MVIIRSPCSDSSVRRSDPSCGALRSKGVSRNANSVNLNEPRYKRESGQPFEEGEACCQPCSNELERLGSPGSKGAAGTDRNVRNLRDLNWR